MRKNRRIYREAASADQGWRDEVRLGQRRAKRVQRMLGVASGGPLFALACIVQQAGVL